MKVELLGGPRDGDVIDMGAGWGEGTPPDYFITADLEHTRSPQYLAPCTREIPPASVPTLRYPYVGRKGEHTLVYRHPRMTRNPD